MIICILSRIVSCGIENTFLSKDIQLPIAPHNACIAVNVYGNGKFPASTSLLYIVKARLKKKYARSQLYDDPRCANIVLIGKLYGDIFAKELIKQRRLL